MCSSCGDCNQSQDGEERELEAVVRKKSAATRGHGGKEGGAGGDEPRVKESARLCIVVVDGGRAKNAGALLAGLRELPQSSLSAFDH